MPKNKSESYNELNRKAEFDAEANQLKPKKAEQFTANLNNIPKNES